MKAADLLLFAANYVIGYSSILTVITVLGIAVSTKI